MVSADALLAQGTIDRAATLGGTWTGALRCTKGIFVLRLRLNRRTSEGRLVGDYQVTNQSGAGTSRTLPAYVNFDNSSRSAHVRLNNWPVAALAPDNIQFSGTFDAGLQLLSAKPLFAGCQPLSLRRDGPVVQLSNPIEPLDASLRSRLNQLQADEG